jgi:hypothetical protein
MTKTGHHDIAEILLKVALSIQENKKSIINQHGIESNVVCLSHISLKKKILFPKIPQCWNGDPNFIG